MEHPLDGAYLRLSRAEEHFGELETVIKAFMDKEYELTLENGRINPEPGIPFTFVRPESPIPPRIPLLVGETIHNLRTRVFINLPPQAQA